MIWYLKEHIASFGVKLHTNGPFQEQFINFVALCRCL
uniref:Uncharacterized protein n=1 Tax=Arundo donax TaxID=35708 RepID=A0A0A9E283_ARUDO